MRKFTHQDLKWDIYIQVSLSCSSHSKYFKHQNRRLKAPSAFQQGCFEHIMLRSSNTNNYNVIMNLDWPVQNYRIMQCRWKSGMLIFIQRLYEMNLQSNPLSISLSLEISHVCSHHYIRIFSCLKLIYGPQQHGLMFGSSFLNHLDMSS